MNRVGIVGGGISGLSAAYFLGQAGIPCRLFEKRSRLGGTIRTETVQECLVEAGPDSWLADKSSAPMTRSDEPMSSGRGGPSRCQRACDCWHPPSHGRP